MEPDDMIRDSEFTFPTMTVKSIDGEGDQFFSGVMNANVIDRVGDLVYPEGVDIRSFMEMGGPIMAGHSELLPNGESAVVARALKVRKSEKGLILDKGEFDTDPLSDYYRGKVKRGFIKGMSIGMRVLEREFKPTRTGREVRHVTKSELIHVALTAQPVNQASLIAAKSFASKIADLEKRLDAVCKSGVSPDRLDELAASIANLSEQLETLKGAIVKPDGGEPTGRDDRLADLTDAASGLLDAALKAAHPELPDAAFIIEVGAEREGGKVVRKYRHLPHHTGAVKDPSDNGTVNKALLRNALARCNQVQPVKESAASFRARAMRHLRRHANALGIGEDSSKKD